MSSVDWQSLNWNGFNVQVYKFILWIIIWSRVLRDQVQVFVSLKCLRALSWTLCLGLESPLACSPREALALWAWGWHCGKNRRLSSRMQLFWRTRTALSFLSWNFSTTALGRGVGGGNRQRRQARDIYPGCLALLPHPFLMPYLGNTNSFQDSALYPNFHKHDLPSLCWSQKMTALGWTIWNCHFYRSTVIDGEGNGTPLQYSCLENPMEGGAW